MIPKNLTIAFALGGALLGTALVVLLPASQFILVMGGAALLVAVLFFWNSLRTLGGDTDIPDEAPREVDHGALGSMIARKKMLLLSLKDLENERKLGKILKEDFDDVSARYRDEVKGLMKQIDAAAEPFRARAEQLATRHLKELGLGGSGAKAAAEDAAANDEILAKDADAETAKPAGAATKPKAEPVKTVDAEVIPTKKSRPHDSVPSMSADSARRACPKCNASNEPDAKFCKECATSLIDAPEKKAESDGAAKDPAAKEPAPAPSEPDERPEPSTKSEGAADA